jgi:hypothetical protein
MLFLATFLWSARNIIRFYQKLLGFLQKKLAFKIVGYLQKVNHERVKKHD